MNEALDAALMSAGYQIEKLQAEIKHLVVQRDAALAQRNALRAEVDQLRIYAGALNERCVKDTAELGRLTAERDALLQRAKRFDAAVAWVLGTNADFSPPDGNVAPYWWRTPLIKMCGIRWDGERWVDAAIDAAKEKKE